MKEAKFQARFGKWLKADNSGRVLFYKLSDLSAGQKPFDCFAIGFTSGSWFGSRGLVACGFELKIGKVGASTIGYSSFTRAMHQFRGLELCAGLGGEEHERGASAGFYVLGYVDKAGLLRVFVVDVDLVSSLIFGELREACMASVRGSISIDWCLEHGEEIIGV